MIPSLPQITLRAVVLSPAQRHALADLNTGTGSVAVTQEPTGADVLVQADDGLWVIEGDGNTIDMEEER